jgi:hypothetical protein
MSFFDILTDYKNVKNHNVECFGIGHSHIKSIEYAISENKDFLNTRNISIKTICLLDDKFKNSLPFESMIKHFFYSKNKVFAWSFKVQRELKAYLRNIKFCFSLFGGNAHNVMGLVNQPESFDFLISDEDESKLIKGARLIPLSIIEKAMMKQGGYPETINCLRSLRETYSGKIFQFESPPPIPSQAHLLKYAGPFKASFIKYGSAPAYLRLKLWKVHSELIRKECKNLGINFISHPSCMIDTKGFLIKKAWDLDTNHANSLYGKALIDQLITQ